MANAVTVNIRVFDSTMSPEQNLPVMLVNPNTDANPFGNPVAYAPTVLFSGNSDANGYTQFTGVQAGVYDIQVINPSGQSVFNYGYIVKNSYVVDPSNVEESRFAVRSGEHIMGVSAGIIARRHDNPMGTMYSNFQWSKQSITTGGFSTGNEIAPPLIQGTGSGSNQFQNQFDGTLFTTRPTFEGKVSGLSYYHDNQNLTNFQKVDLVLR